MRASARAYDEVGVAPSDLDSVLFLIHDLCLGGAERAFLNYVNHVRGIRPVVALVRGNVELDELKPTLPLFDLSATPASRPFDGLRHRLPETRIAALLRKSRRLSHLARTTGSVAVSSFLHKSHIISLLAKLAFQPRLRVIINVHETVSQHLEHHFPPVERSFMRLFTRFLYPQADLIVAVAEGVKRDLVQNFGLPPDRIVVVHNPIDLARVRAQAAEPVALPGHAGAGCPRVVAVGRLEKLKGFDLLIRAFACLPRGLGATLLIIGDGGERSALARLIEELRLQEHVTLIGYQENPWKYMAGADAFVLCSRTEAFPSVIGEALALCLPVLATNCCAGVREYARNGECALLVPPEDVGALAQGLERLLTDAALRQRLSRQGPARVEPLDLSTAVASYETAIRALLRFPTAADRSG